MRTPRSSGAILKVNEFYRATKPHPDRGVDGVTSDGIPIQVKTFKVKYDTIDKLRSGSEHHSLVPKPITKLIVVSQVGFDDSAVERQDSMRRIDGVEVVLITPKEMLKIEN